MFYLNSYKALLGYGGNMKTRLIFVRHAEAEGNLKRLFHGWYDSSITEKGHKQAKKVAERLSDVPIEVIYSSSLKRTLQTAQYIADVKQLPIIRTDKMKEINGGMRYLNCILTRTIPGKRSHIFTKCRTAKAWRNFTTE
jgi:methionine salvage enolase-phosphatase E1